MGRRRSTPSRRFGGRLARRLPLSALPAVAGSLAVCLAVAGCSGGGAGGGSAGSGGGQAIAAKPGMAQGDVARGAASPPKSATGTANVLPAGHVLLGSDIPSTRAIVYDGDLTERVRDVSAAANRAVSIATAAGGYLFGEQSGGGDDPGSTDLTLKVPAARFNGVLISLRQLGTQLASSVNAQDVTGQVVDLQSRVATAKASVTRVRALLARATGIGDIIDIEGELTKREAELESLEGQLRVLTDQVALGTIDLHLTKAGKVAPVRHHHKASGFIGGLRTGWHAFTVAFTASLAVLGAVLPFLIGVGVVGGLAWWVRRGVRARRRPATAPASEA
jgi:Domain of unknown function (DUF4349)